MLCPVYFKIEIYLARSYLLSIFLTFVYIFFSAATNKRPNISDHPIKIECKKCGQTFQKAYDLMKHQDDFHNNQPNISGEAAKVKLPCRIKECGQFFSSMKDLNQHEKKFHPKRKIVSLDFSCDVCGEVLNTANRLRAHMKLKHNNEKVLNNLMSPDDESSADDIAHHHTCEECNCVFKSREKLNWHKKGHVKRPSSSHKKRLAEQKAKAPKPSKYGDVRCVDRIGASIQHIKKADRTKCALCNNRDFGSNITLEKHINSAHSNAANRCGLCTMVFVSMDELKEHYTNQHGI